MNSILLQESYKKTSTSDIVKILQRTLRRAKGASGPSGASVASVASVASGASGASGASVASPTSIASNVTAKKYAKQLKETKQLGIAQKVSEEEKYEDDFEPEDAPGASISGVVAAKKIAGQLKKKAQKEDDYSDDPFEPAPQTTLVGAPGIKLPTPTVHTDIICSDTTPCPDPNQSCINNYCIEDAEKMPDDTPGATKEAWASQKGVTFSTKDC